MAGEGWALLEVWEMSETTPQNFGCGSAIGLSIVMFASGAGVGCAIEDHFVKLQMQAKAVELGAAEWQLDQKTGETKFTWREKEK